MELEKVSELLDPYGLSATEIRKMEGYASQNFRIKDTNGREYVLKYHENKSDLPIIKAESKLQKYLSRKLDFNVSQPAFDKAFHSLEDGSFSRVLSFLDGKFLGESEHSNRLLFNFGIAIGKLSMALQSYRDPVIEAHRHNWDLNRSLSVWPMAKYIEDHSKRKLVNYFFDQYQQFHQPTIPTLRHSIIHNDLNDWNVLIQDHKICGIIDFGDFCYAPLINELAIALTYIMLSKKHPIRMACHVIKGYQQILPLTRQEVESLYYLIPARLCQSVCHSQRKVSLGMDSEYIRISEAPAWELLEKWTSFNPIYIKNRFSKAASFLDNPNPETQKISKFRKNHLGPSLSTSYNEPIHMAGSSFQYMFDSIGNSYLDAYNNIPHVGHCHPKVTHAISEQVKKLNTNTRYYFDSIAEYGEKLLYHFPKHLNRIYFVNSGSEASDLAIRMARHFTQRPHMLALEHGYHGHTQSGIEISHYKFNGQGGPGQSRHTKVLPLPRLYQGPFANRKEYVKDARRIISELCEQKMTPAALITESISGCGGQVPLPEGYLEGIQPFLRENRILTIMDEVQVGFGRVGETFWGFQLQNIEPDIVILGKPMANGHPIGAVVTTEEIADSFDTGMEFFSSFGGNPVSMQAAKAVLETIEEEGLQNNALEVGNYWKSKLAEIQSQWIGDIRGKGLFIGIEFSHPETRLPATEFAKEIKNELRSQYILSSTDGPYDNVLKMKPPMCFSKRNVDTFVSVLDDIINQRESQGFIPGKN